MSTKGNNDKPNNITEEEIEEDLTCGLNDEERILSEGEMVVGEWNF